MRLTENLVLTVSPRGYHNTLERFLATADSVAVNGVETFEALNSTLLLKNPIDRLVMDPARRLNPGFAAAEWYSFMTGEDDISFFQKFIHNYDRFSSDGKTLDGCYGTRVQGLAGSNSQLIGVIDELKRDPSTRRAVVSIYDGKLDLFGGGGRNTPCTETIQFLLRGGKLQTIVNMRSFDLIKGFSYDIYVFTMLAEYVARQLGVDLGFYYHNAGSMHVYESDMPMISAMGKAPRWPLLMKKMPKIEHGDIARWHEMTAHIFANPQDFMSVIHKPQFSSPEVQNYLVTQTAVMVSFAQRRESPHLALQAHDAVDSPSLKKLLRIWLSSAGIVSSKHHL